ncbi:GNAT family N-acetyltransferase [Pseudalkalibacillus sp. Hm43]|uniref:GNAT family N-acetyltransferase n=1 Tax=Pseudalkalibacillus sp. Hm43 TaxID=3450742 RepID=UPI003F434A48
MNAYVGENMKVKTATMEDINTVLDLLVNAAEWIQTKGTTQWDYYLNDLEGNTQEVKDSIRNGSTFLFYEKERPIATATLELKPSEWDFDMWEDEANDPVVYLHRVVVHRDFAGEGLGNQILDWSEDYVRESGLNTMRFDCLASNESLNAYYQKRYPLKEVKNKFGQHCKYEVEL